MSITLNGDQINEVEKRPVEIIGNCVERLKVILEPAKLCEAFYSYLLKKCEGLDYLANYCVGVLVYKEKKTLNEQKINTQKSCVLNPPLPTNRSGIEKYYRFAFTKHLVRNINISYTDFL